MIRFEFLYFWSHVGLFSNKLNPDVCVFLYYWPEPLWPHSLRFCAASALLFWSIGFNLEVQLQKKPEDGREDRKLQNHCCQSWKLVMKSAEHIIDSQLKETLFLKNPKTREANLLPGWLFCASAFMSSQYDGVIRPVGHTRCFLIQRIKS